MAVNDALWNYSENIDLRSAQTLSRTSALAASFPRVSRSVFVPAERQTRKKTTWGEIKIT